MIELPASPRDMKSRPGSRAFLGVSRDGVCPPQPREAVFAGLVSFSDDTCAGGGRRRALQAAHHHGAATPSEIHRMLGPVPGLASGTRPSHADHLRQLRRRSVGGSYPQLSEGHAVGLVSTRLPRSGRVRGSGHRHRNRHCPRRLPHCDRRRRNGDRTRGRYHHHRRPDEGPGRSLARSPGKGKAVCGRNPS